MANKDKKSFYEAIVELQENHSPVSTYKKVFKEYFNEEPTQDQINTYQKQLNEKYEEENSGWDDDESYDSYEESYEDDEF